MADPADLGLTADALRHLPAADPTAAALGHLPAADPTAAAGHDALPNGGQQPLTERDLDELSEQERYEPEAIQFAAAEREFSSDESELLEDEVGLLAMECLQSCPLSGCVLIGLAALNPNADHNQMPTTIKCIPQATLW